VKTRPYEKSEDRPYEKMDRSLPATTTLDVLIATRRRPQMLERALESVFAARVPDSLDVHVVVIGNENGQDQTIATVQRLGARFPGRLTYLVEPTGGKSSALNRGLRETSGVLVGFIDDDEEIDEHWFDTIAEAFRDPQLEFIGGPCLPKWGATPPNWLPSTWRGVIGFVDDGDRVMVFGQDAPGILMGGNSVIRRRTLEQVGYYSPDLGPRPDARLLSGEDEELFSRLLAAGAHGLYLPKLRIYHYVPPQRLTKSYYRRWSFWHGVSRSVIDSARPSNVKRVGRVPRYLYGTAARAAFGTARFLFRDRARQFANELELWHLAGFVYGSYWYRETAR
jgi:glycosyltransferase involved in cell wall biosynthesis